MSQNWFPVSERLLATAVLALSLPLGIVCGQGISPAFVKKASDVPMMNLVSPARSTRCRCGLALLLSPCFSAYSSSAPPSLRLLLGKFSVYHTNIFKWFVSFLFFSLSAELAAQQERKTFREYLSNMKAVMTNKPFLLLFLVIGGAVGFFNAISTQLSQLMCSRGYENWYSGMVGSLLLGTGFLGAIVTGIIVDKTGKMEEVSKLCFGIAGIFGILLVEFMRLSDKGVWITIFASAFGVFGFGMYPIALELSVEATYPLDESLGTAMVFLSGQLQGGVLVFLSQMLEQPLDKEALQLQVCDEGGPDTSAKDHTVFLMVLAGYITAICTIFIAFFHTEYKRTLANQAREAVGEESLGRDTPSLTE